MSDPRTAKFRRNELLEELLVQLGMDLEPAEERLVAQFQELAELKYPVIFIMGALRSGTTLFTQWLANTGMVAYPTNLLSRFYQAPIVGAKIQLLLSDSRYNFRDELGEFARQVEYKSENGKTKGALAPNEFWYFWRRFLPESNRDVWTDNELRQGMDTRTMLAELLGMMEVFQKPFAAKGMLFNYNIPFLASVLDKVLFVHIQRDPAANIASILEARERQFGTQNTWYSFKIPEYEQLKDLTPLEQAAGQVFYINKAIESGLSGLAEHKKMTVKYEKFCENPESIFNELKSKLALNGFETEVSYALQPHFELSRKIESNEEYLSAYRSFGG